jgi:hypothetical protein
MAVLPGVARAQGRVTRIVGPDNSAVAFTKDVQLIRLGSVEPMVVTRGDSLGFGDELKSTSGATIVVLSCSDTTGMTLEGQFRAVVMPQPGKACVLNLFAGTAHVQGDASTGLGLGEVTMGAQRTEYSVSVSRSDSGVRRELTVFDGEVEVRSTGRPDSRTIAAGNTLAVERGEYRQQQITPSDFQSAASLYARVDASSVNADERPGVMGVLYQNYLRVLARPDDADARFDLIAHQVQSGATSKTTLYQIQRVKLRAPQTSQLDAATAALSVAAYTQLGEEGKASAHYEVLRRYDAPTVQAALASFRIDTTMVRRAGHLDMRRTVNVVLTQQVLRVSVAARPATISVAQPTRIFVKVSTSSGTPVQANVRISAGGGVFAGGGTSVDGLTNADGVFTTVWRCHPCAPAYELSVQVAKEGFVTADTTLSVRVQ